MSTQMLYLSQIRTVLRTEPFDTVEMFSGQFHDVLDITKAWIFRFPRHRESVTRLEEEMHLLEALRGRLPLPIPDPVYQSFNPPVPGLAFLGYRLLPGEPFYRQMLEGVTSEWVRDDLASQLARFLRSLHHIPLAELHNVLPAGAPVGERRDEWEAMYRSVREKLFPAMRPDARRKVTELFESYLDDPALHDFGPCLRHGDFGGSNILWEPERGAICGVIDFSSCGLGDPAVDLASISTQGQDFYERLAPRYEPDPDRRSPLLARARFYRGTFALQEALDGLRMDDPEAYRRGMQGFFPG